MHDKNNLLNMLFKIIERYFYELVISILALQKHRNQGTYHSINSQNVW